MREVTVDLMVPMTVRVDLDEGVATEAWLHLECFQDAPRGRFSRTEEDGRDWEVCFRDVFFPGHYQDEAGAWQEFPKEVAEREVCDGEHPLADEAFEIVNRYRVEGNPEFQVRLEMD